MINEALSMTDTFNNPFEEINANVINSKSIVEYWCDPFSLGLLTNFDEKKFCTSKVPIVIQGSRGSGKTTILKYFSFPAQVERTYIYNEKSIMNRIKEEGEVGFYFRCEESFVSTFIAIFQNTNPENWTKHFECYIELVFTQKILEMLLSLQERGEIDTFPSESIQFVLGQIGINKYRGLDLKGFYDFVHNEVVYFEQYKNKIVFINEQFEPNLFVDIFSLSSAIISEIKKLFPLLKNVLFVLMIDEYENLNAELQKRFNTIIKFVKQDVSIRVGRRSEGRFTTETVNEIEYLRENHDYYLATIGKEQDIKVCKEYFLQVANLRFRKSNSKFCNSEGWDIRCLLGDMEDLLEECKEVCGQRKNHLEVILRQSSELASDAKLRKSIIDIIKNDDNPIAETINALWVLRDKKKNYIKTAEYAVESMEAYFKGIESVGVKKYKADYSNKYRYAITIFICSVYKKDKMYYGFNALSHLANGNVRTFINFCQSIINEALFYEKNSFLRNAKVSKEVQSNAIRSFSRSEFDSICSVVYAGDKIRRFVMNLGNSFSIYHKDRKIRYPETTQFVMKTSDLDKEDLKVLQTAESWAIINKRQKVQRASAGIEGRTELYYMNKMFSPLFNMSYRTRGGVNMRLNREEVHSMLSIDSYLPLSVRNLLTGQDNSTSDDYVAEKNRQMTVYDLVIKNE